MTAARMLLDRTLPNKRPEQERVEIEHSGNIASDAQNVLRSVLDGEVSPDVGASAFERHDKRFEGYRGGRLGSAS